MSIRYCTILFCPLSFGCQLHTRAAWRPRPRPRPSPPSLVRNTDRHPLRLRRPSATCRPPSPELPTYTPYSRTVLATYPSPVLPPSVWLWLDLIPRPSLARSYLSATSLALVTISLAGVGASIVGGIVFIVVVQVVIENSCPIPT